MIEDDERTPGRRPVTQASLVAAGYASIALVYIIVSD